MSAPLGPAAFAEALVGDDPIPSVITATRLNQSLLDVPASVTVIDQAMIRASGARELPDLLTQVPGLMVSREDGSTAFVSVHGMAIGEARRMQVMIDGRSVYGAGIAEVDWMALPLAVEDVERIEVVRGPDSATYGANSFLGVINIITKHPADVTGVEVHGRKGAQGVADGFARIGVHHDDSDWAWSVFSRSDDGYFNRNLKHPSQAYLDGKRVDGLRGQGVYALPSDGQLQVGVGASQMRTYEGQRFDPPLMPGTPIMEDGQGYVSLSLDQPLNSAHQLKSSFQTSWRNVGFAFQENLPYLALSPQLAALYGNSPALADSFANDPLGTCTGPAVVTNANLRTVCGLLANGNYTTPRLYNGSNNYHERRSDLSLSDTWVINPKLRVVYGWTGILSYGESQTFLAGAVTSRVNNFYAHGEWRLAPAWLLNLGATEESDSLSGSNFSPRAALSWRPTDNQVVRFIYSEAVRTPDIFEQRANWHLYMTTANPAQSQYNGAFFQSALSPGNAQTEHIRSSEISYFGQHQPSHLSGDIRFFRDELELESNNLELDSFALTPLSHRVMYGVELGPSWQFTTYQRLIATYSRLRITMPPDTDDNYYTPKNAGTLGWMRSDPDGWNASVVYTYYDNLPTAFRYEVANMHLGKVIPIGRQRLELGMTLLCRLDNDPQLRSDNGMSSRYKGWVDAGWRF